MTKKGHSWWLWWPLGAVLTATALLWRPVLQLFWYRDDYPTLYWLLHPQGPVNPADVGDYKLAIYHGLLQVHWPMVQLFGTNVIAHRAGQLLLLLLLVGLFFVLAYRLTNSWLAATLASLIVATTPIAFISAERVSLAYQDYLSVSFMIVVLLLLWGWVKSHRVGWLMGAGSLFLLALYLTGVRLHSAFIGIGLVGYWLLLQSSVPTRQQRQFWWFGAVIALATIVMVLADGLGRNHVAFAPTFLSDFISSLGHLVLPSHGLERLFAPHADLPAAIVTLYQELVAGIGVVAALIVLSFTTKPRWVGWLIGGFTLILAAGFWFQLPDVSHGDRTHEARAWLGLLSGLELLLIGLGLAFSWRGHPKLQLALVGLVWAIVGFLPPFLVQPGAPFGTADHYFIGSVLGIGLFWLGLVIFWLERRIWFGVAGLIALIVAQGWLTSLSLGQELTDHAQPARALFAQLARYPDALTPPSRLVFLAQPSSQAAYRLHEAFAASTIPDEAILTVLFHAPYDTRQLRISTLEEAATDVRLGEIDASQVFVFGYGVEDGLVDLSGTTRPLLPTITTDTQADLIRTQLLTTVR